jgi:hypothetical protein
VHDIKVKVKEELKRALVAETVVRLLQCAGDPRKATLRGPSDSLYRSPHTDIPPYFR